MKTAPLTVFQDFAPPVRAQSSLRRAITAAYRWPEAKCVEDLMGLADTPPPLRAFVTRTATDLIEALRAKGQRGGVEGLVKEYALSSQEGVALMCLAEALLRIPDRPTRDVLIRDKIANGDWRAHLGEGRSLFVNAATWGLVVTGKLVGSVNETGLGAALTRLVARCGEPVIRRGVDMAMEMMGEQFVTGETIEEALKRARKLEAQGFAYSYDMLGEAAATAADAARYLAYYEQAIHAIGRASTGRGIYAGPGISIKLSALHPRYARAQAQRIMTELLPRVQGLAVLAKHYDIGFNIDAEEADRLELSLDLLQELAFDPVLTGWNGLGFVVQAYGKRCPYVIDWIVNLATESKRRIMVRLVKGAYWDSEIKRAQVDGLADFPVFTRKVHTDLSYIACARKLLAAKHAIFPQFATHNAQTVATVFQLAGPEFALGDYEFQCLHGMGEPLYEEVVGPDKLARPCRIYAPVGTHETLLAYLVRRLLENGANSSFVNRIWDEAISVETLAEDPVSVARQILPLGAPHPIVALPSKLFAERINSSGLNLSDEDTLALLSEQLIEGAKIEWNAAPDGGEGAPRLVRNPADYRDCVGTVVEAEVGHIADAMARSLVAFDGWTGTIIDDRALCLERAAAILQARMPTLLGLIVREAGKSLPNAIAEVREAIDFLRYYAAQARMTLTPSHLPLGPVVCISPWNFPLAIFTGQIAAALVAGNTVLAKPAEETPLIAAEAVRILHQAGIPNDVLQLLPGDGRVGAGLVAQERTAAVLFTGSTEVAKLIQAELANHVSPHGAPIPLIAETGGQNAMIVDSSALAEQVVADVMVSAFDSAGQRCSALRILCLQDDIADRQIEMLKGALAELSIGRTDLLSSDIGPVISDEARVAINSHIERMRSIGCTVAQVPLPDGTSHGTFVAPTIIEIDRIEQIGREVFGPVLHVLRFRRQALDELVDEINATGYGLTFGLHTRIDETVARVAARAGAGNIYINRNVVGAVVGVQPFGGRGLSGTGPKAGGPLYLGRLVQSFAATPFTGSAAPNDVLEQFASWLRSKGDEARAARAQAAQTNSILGFRQELSGPVGEENVYAIHPRGSVLLVPHTVDGLMDQLIAVLAAGNSATVILAGEAQFVLDELPPAVAERVTWRGDLPTQSTFAAVLIEPQPSGIAQTLLDIAAMGGMIPIVQLGDPNGSYRNDWLVEETSTSTNTTAAGGNASLMVLV